MLHRSHTPLSLPLPSLRLTQVYVQFNSYLINSQNSAYEQCDKDVARAAFLARGKAEQLLRSMLPPQILTEYMNGEVGQIANTATIGFCLIDMGGLDKGPGKAWFVRCVVLCGLCLVTS
jgi:hypothetical protein